MSRTPTKVDLVEIVEGSRKLSPHTKRAYLASVRRFLAFAGEDPRKWTGATAQRFYDHLEKDGKLAPRSANQVLWGVSYAFGRAAKLYGIENIVSAVERTATRGKLRGDGSGKALTPEQARALLRACEGKDIIARRDGAACVLGLYTGMRRVSLVSTLGRARELGRVALLTTTLKGGDLYEVPLFGELWGSYAIGAYRVQLAMMAQRQGVAFDTTKPLLRRFGQLTSLEDHTRAIGDGITEDGLYKALVERARKAGIPDFHPHLFRNTFITWCREDGVEDRWIKAVTGHGGGILGRYTDRDTVASQVAEIVHKTVSARVGAMVG